MRAVHLFVLLLLGTAVFAGAQEEPPPRNPFLDHLLIAADPRLARADARYHDRHEGHVGATASVAPISDAIAAYEAAVARQPHDPEPRWKLARAFYFQATYTGQSSEARRTILEKARRAGEEALGILADRAEARGARRFDKQPPAEKARWLHADPDAAPSYFWTAVAWGEWALSVGKMQAARTGAASRIRDYSGTVIALAPDFEEGGGYRILGRLHDQAPRIPFVTGWVSRREALRNLRLALEVAPGNFVNRLFLAEALARGSSSERAESLRIVKDLVAAAPSSGHLVEELWIQEQARRDLARWLGGSGDRKVPR